MLSLKHSISKGKPDQHTCSPKETKSKTLNCENELWSHLGHSQHIKRKEKKREKQECITCNMGEYWFSFFCLCNSWWITSRLGKQWHTLFFQAPRSLLMVTAAMKLKDTYSLEVKLWQHIKKQRHYFVNKGPSSQGYGFSCSHVWMWELDYKENWAPKNWCFWTVVLEKTLESPLDCKEIQPVHPKGHQSWVFIGRTDVEAETPILWPPDTKSWLSWKDADARKNWRQEEKGMTEDEMVGWHHWLNGHEFGWTPVVGDGQGGLACCDSWSCEESDTTEQLNWTE